MPGGSEQWGRAALWNSRWGTEGLGDLVRAFHSTGQRLKARVVLGRCTSIALGPPADVLLCQWDCHYGHVCDVTPVYLRDRIKTLIP